MYGRDADAPPVKADKPVLACGILWYHGLTPPITPELAPGARPALYGGNCERKNFDRGR